MLPNPLQAGATLMIILVILFGGCLDSNATGSSAKANQAPGGNVAPADATKTSLQATPLKIEGSTPGYLCVRPVVQSECSLYYYDAFPAQNSRVSLEGPGTMTRFEATATFDASPRPAVNELVVYLLVDETFPQGGKSARGTSPLTIDFDLSGYASAGSLQITVFQQTAQSAAGAGFTLGTPQDFKIDGTVWSAP